MTVSFSKVVVRPEDLLVVKLDFYHVNWVLPEADEPGQVQGAPGAYVVVNLQPQHIAEQVFPLEAFDDPSLALANGNLFEPGDDVGFRLAGPSRLAFDIPPGKSIPYTLEGLLGALTELPLRLAPVGAYDPQSGGSPPAITEPDSAVTAIEAPYRLILSPGADGRWAHAPGPVRQGNWRTELWHTRLGTTSGSGEVGLRAIWSPDFPDDGAFDPFASSLDSADRRGLVRATSGWNIQGYTPKPVHAEELMLTSLGAWARLHGEWTPVAPAKITEWRHVMTMGRDHHGRLVKEGYLFPFGHRAALVKITERRFTYNAAPPTPGFVAYLYQRMFIVVREPVLREFDRHAIPFKTVTLKTQVTPDVALPGDCDKAKIGNYSTGAFWPMVRTGNPEFTDFQFHFVATDWEDRTVEFSMPLIFLDLDVDVKNAADIVKEYGDYAVTDDRRRRPMGGQSIAFAPRQKHGDTTFETGEMVFAAEHDASATPHFWPAMQQATVDIPAVQQITGSKAVSTIEWEAGFKGAVGDAKWNEAQMFAVIKDGPEVKFEPGQSGGLVTPNFQISGLSRVLGPVGGAAEKMAAGLFRPAEIFGDVKLLGGLRLSDIIKDQSLDVSSDTPTAPQLVTVREGDVQKTSYQWVLKSPDAFKESLLFIPGPGVRLDLNTVITSPLNGDASTFFSQGKLEDFSLVLLAPASEEEPADPNLSPELVKIHFRSVTFTARQGEKVDVAVVLADIEFLGILAFVNDLKDYIPLDGFSDPPNLEVVGPPDPGLRLGFSLGIPTIGVGIMTMQNVSLSAGFYLPFGDTPMSVRFAFCERQQPFILTVMGLGGGGFVAIELDLTGVKVLEASLEYGASVAINLGVASGVVSIMGGFYFQAVANDVSFTAYLRACGALSVLGIITVSCEFYLGLTYTPKGDLPHAGTMWGQATVTVKIKLLFFSKSVSVSMEREIAGSDPCFREMVAPDQWALYCTAFDAAYPAVTGD